MFGHAVDDAAGPFLTPGQQVEQAAEGSEEHHPDGGGHQHQDRRRAGGVAVHARDPESVGPEEPDQRAPENDVEHHGRPDALRAEGESGVGPGHARLGHQPVAQGRSRCGAAGGHVAEGQGREVDPEEPEPRRAAVGEDGVGQLGVGDQRGDLQQDAQRQVGHIDVGQRPHLGAVAGQQGDGHVEDEQEDEDRAHAEADLAAHERATVPPPAAPGTTCRISLRHLCRVGHHRPHVDTARPPDLPC